ncbi:MAG: zinc ribbon domain-containing protein [Candidatus Methanomethylophilaceae archaeon]|nr:zinc ribbon domain-containing protein [Candidatus Methanomethylophilaceae archaeon]
MEEKPNFCTRCGASLPEGAEYCPYCGNDPGGRTENRHVRTEDENKLDNTRICILIYSFIALAFGIIILLSSLAVTDEFWEVFISQMSDYPEIADSLSNITAEELRNSMMLEGGAILGSGILAMISAVAIKRQRGFAAAFISCVISSFLTLAVFPFGIITLLIGLYMAYRINRYKHLFCS